MVYMLCMWISFPHFSVHRRGFPAIVERMFTVQTDTEVREAAERLRHLVTELDLGEVLPATAKDLVEVGEQIERTGRILKLMASAIVDATAAWKGDGDRSLEDWLARTTGSSKTEATRTAATGRRLRKLPKVARAARQGALSPEQTAAIADAATADPSAQQDLLDAAERNDLRGLKQACKTTKANADRDPEATRRRIHARRSCRTWTDDDGVGHLHLSGPSDAIARMDHAIRQRADRGFRHARAEGRREPSEAYQFDAAEELLASSGGVPAPKGSDAKIIVRVDYPSLLRGRCLSGETCEIAGMGPIPVSVVQEWLQDAFLAVVVTKGTEITKVIHLGRRFTAEQRTALQWADPVCARKGCSNRLGLEYDHFEDWATTHTTRFTAGKRFCHGCHHLKSQGWDVSDPDDDGECTFTPPDRREILRQISDNVALARANRRRGPPG